MQVRVLFFGMLKDLAGCSRDSLSLPDGATLRDVLRHYEERIPHMRSMLPSVAVSINQAYAQPETVLGPGDEIAFLPPVSGGSPDPTVDTLGGRRSFVRIVRKKIDVAGLLQILKCAADGAAVVFEGVVRDNSRGRRTLFLDYEAYEDMALKQMNGLAEQALAQFPVRDVAIVHRIGRLEVGETSVAIVVVSAHRAAAFDACRWLIDTLKRTVPIWKKEHFEDGAIWADGEPFPATIAAAGSHLGKPASK